MKTGNAAPLDQLLAARLALGSNPEETEVDSIHFQP